MPQYEGFVAGLKKNGKAEVVIQPCNAGIPGAPQLKDIVCHCATAGSTITIEVLNKADAGVGDWVSITQRPGALMKNAAILLGIPVVGLLAGIAVASIITHGFASHIAGGILVLTACLLLGIIIGVITYRRVSTGNQPVIDQIIRTRLNAISLLDDNQSPLQNRDRSCEGCSGPFL
ncbi:MAG: SoxR reducing system RseC family protein [Deltaproteobacteria bacterium]|nr:SoxR reducing system RseC family protein [Deltaproteobacteria bacterium]MBL7205852.1 SoxR reducing system RseC family protein [Desulfobacteraceae bacterium]